MKVSNALEILAALNKISDMDIPAMVSYKFARNIQILNPIAETFEAKRAELIKKVIGEENIKSDGTFTTTPQQSEELNKEIKALLDTDEPSLDSLFKIKIDSLSGVNMPLPVIQSLMPILED